MIVTAYVEIPSPGNEEARPEIRRIVYKQAAPSEALLKHDILTRLRGAYPTAVLSFGPVSEEGFGR